MAFYLTFLLDCFCQKLLQDSVFNLQVLCFLDKFWVADTKMLDREICEHLLNSVVFQQRADGTLVVLDIIIDLKREFVESFLNEELAQVRRLVPFLELELLNFRVGQHGKYDVIVRVRL